MPYVVPITKIEVMIRSKKFLSLEFVVHHYESARHFSLSNLKPELSQIITHMHHQWDFKLIQKIFFGICWLFFPDF